MILAVAMLIYATLAALAKMGQKFSAWGMDRDLGLKITTLVI